MVSGGCASPIQNRPRIVTSSEHRPVSRTDLLMVSRSVYSPAAMAICPSSATAVSASRMVTKGACCVPSAPVASAV